MAARSRSPTASASTVAAAGASLERSTSLARQLHGRRAARRARAVRAPARPRDDLPHRRAAARDGRRPSAARRAAAPTYVRCRPEHHHHLVCTSCGAVEETELCAAPSEAELRAPARLPRRRARARHLRHLPARARDLDRDPARRASPSSRRSLAASWRSGSRATWRPRSRSPAASSSRSRSSTCCPEAIEAVDDPHRVGIARRRRLPRLLPRRARARPAPPRRRPSRRARTPRSAPSARPGLSLHSFIDGLGIGLAFGVSTGDRPARLRRRRLRTTSPTA